ncbi:MAG: YihY/virulence factor BrkB family protein [Terracidiphilus sp.]|nr:YihY/virulence factor BrkB family protein [Terracidiphilus sp.]
MINGGHNPVRSFNARQHFIWELVSRSPLHSHWDLQGVSVVILAKRTWMSLFADNIFGRAAELGFYFLFALFPTLFSASSILGLAARSAAQFYDKLLAYLSLVIPTSALGTVLTTFNETTAAASRGKLTFGLIAAVWSASVGISAIQDALNAVYKVQDSRSYLRAHVYAIGLTVVLTVIATLILSAMLGGDYVAAVANHSMYDPALRTAVACLAKFLGWTAATALLALSFSAIYYWAPDVKARRWHWLTPGCAVGIAGWLLASFGLRIYLHFFNSYTFTYGSLGAVIVLLTWFYISGLMLLVGAEINSQIEAAAAQRRLAERSARTPAS